MSDDYDTDNVSKSPRWDLNPRPKVFALHSSSFSSSLHPFYPRAQDYETFALPAELLGRSFLPSYSHLLLCFAQFRSAAVEDYLKRTDACNFKQHYLARFTQNTPMHQGAPRYDNTETYHELIVNEDLKKSKKICLTNSLMISPRR